MPRRMIRIATEADFWAMGKPQADGCIHWTGKVDDAGYGRMGPTLTGTVYVHRSAYLLAHGEIPGKLTVEHNCHSDSDCTAGNDCLHRRCMNPEHLCLLTKGENASLQHWEITETCPSGHDKKTLPSGQRYCPTCTSVAMKAWRGKDGNRKKDNAMRQERRR